MQSPEYVQISQAAAMALSYRPALFRRNACLTGLNLLVTYPDGCMARCAYCGLHHQRQVPPGKQKTFIRVDWPTYSLEDVLARLKRDNGHLRRVCVGMITHRRAFDDMNTVIRRFREECDLPISALIAPTLIRPSQLEETKKAGADMVGIAIDAATPELFDRFRGRGVGGPHRWEHYWAVLEEAVRIFGRYKVGVHLIVGLGETEQEMIATIQRAHDLGAHTHLFSFFPEAGSLLEDHPQPPYGQYRRVQLARYIINLGYGRYEQMDFNERGQVVHFGVPVDDLIRYGEPFMTSGCPGPDGRVACNRPFGNERAGQPMRNYPFLPEPEDVELIRYQLREY
ncbi:MAG: radical SAM protein [Thermoflexales bacterium]|nr:radical SAM protein [Thermoflexales bacterium]